MRSAFIICLMASIFLPRNVRYVPGGQESYYAEAVGTLRLQVLEDAAWAMQQEPVTITAYQAAGSAGGKHDFFSEGDYFWPKPQKRRQPLYFKRWNDQPR